MNTIKIIDYDLSDTPCILEVAIFGDLSYFCQILKSIRSFHACQDTQFSFNKKIKITKPTKTAETFQKAITEHLSLFINIYLNP